MPGPRDGATVAAVVDVGSNSSLLLAVAVEATGRARALDEALVTTRLGAGLRIGGTLDPAARARASAAVVDLVTRARAVGADRVWAFATGAVRRALDGPAFAAELAAAAGVPVEVLSGEREATLAYRAAVYGLGCGDTPVLVTDIGAATTELTTGRGDAIAAAVSVPLGALALTEAHLHEDPPGARAVAAVVAAVDAALSGVPSLVSARGRAPSLIASGGTATALAAIDLGLARYDPSRVHGHRLGRDVVAALAERLIRMPAAERAGLGGLDPGRAAILPAGALVLDGILRHANAGEVLVSDHGVRHAYLRERLADVGVTADLRSLWS
jgi:exopolyphosphatase/guanosine-5'-triphosphate,3'-diphosphate pyrophosphatase